MKKVVAFRLSSMGDVALTVPALKAVLEANGDLEITLVTRKVFAPFFNAIPRLRLYFADFQGRHQGLWGVLRLYMDLKKEGPFEEVIDLHGVLRTKFLTFLFEKSGLPAYKIDKGKKAKEFIIKSKYIRTQKHSIERYLGTFHSGGFKGQIGKAPFFILNDEAVLQSSTFVENNTCYPSNIKIGLAPFANCKPKIWGITNFKILTDLINAEHKVDFYLFGGGESEISQLKEFQQNIPNVHLASGQLNLSDELALFRRLDLMISMDSSNMHLAALSGVPTISIWGGTHPAFGFSAFGQPVEYHIQTPVHSLKCRPCSVFGMKPCIYGSPKCMEMVKPSDVYKSLIKFNLLDIRTKK